MSNEHEDPILHVVGRFEAKLQQLMPEAEFDSFISSVAMEAVMLEVKATGDKDFEKFVMSNWEAIMSGEISEDILSRTSSETS